MTRLTLQFENASVMKRLIKVIELMKGVSIVEVTMPEKSGLETALEEIEKGKVHKAKNVDDLFQQILG